MNKSALFTYPFEQDLIDQTFLNAPALVINASYDSNFDNISNALIVQNYKYNFAGWEAKGYNVSTEIPSDTKFKTIFCQIPQSKEHSLYLMAESFNALEENGVLICMAGNNENGKRLKKWFESFGLNAQSESKQKQRIVWAYKENIQQEIVNEYIEKYGIKKVVSNGIEFYTKPGIYGWNKIDNGSQLLVNRLPNNLKGFGADYGCGYGFLSQSIVNENIKSIDCIDADYSALYCAEKNIINANCQLKFIHMDLVSNKAEKKYVKAIIFLIVMDKNIVTHIII